MGKSMGKRVKKLGLTGLYRPSTGCAKRSSVSKWSCQKRKQLLGGNTEGVSNSYQFVKNSGVFATITPLLLCQVL